MRGRLDGRVALVTGGGSGLGRAIVERFVAEGASCVVLDRSAVHLRSLDDLGSAVVGIRGDVTEPADNRLAVEAAHERFDRLDTFIGNAGIWDFRRSLIDMTENEIVAGFHEIFSVNVLGYLLGARAAAESLAATQGSIILSGSNASFFPDGGGVLYTASKHAFTGVVRQLAFEFAPGVRVNGVAPGGMATALAGATSLGQDRIDFGEHLAEIVPDRPMSPLHHLGLPDPRLMTGAYVMLADPVDSAAITGEIISVDGGLAARGLFAPVGDTLPVPDRPEEAPSRGSVEGAAR